MLRELQQVADSSDGSKRNRGRRGLDILQRIQKMPQLSVQIVEDDFPNIREVDMKLIELAKLYNCKIMTNDFNLNKVAQVRGVEVLNINELANGLKPLVLPGNHARLYPERRQGAEPGGRLFGRRHHGSCRQRPQADFENRRRYGDERPANDRRENDFWPLRRPHASESAKPQVGSHK